MTREEEKDMDEKGAQRVVFQVPRGSGALVSVQILQLAVYEWP